MARVVVVAILLLLSCLGLLLKRITVLLIGLSRRRSSGPLRVPAYLVAVGRRTLVIGAAVVATVVAGSGGEDLGRVHRVEDLIGTQLYSVCVIPRIGGVRFPGLLCLAQLGSR